MKARFVLRALVWSAVFSCAVLSCAVLSSTLLSCSLVQTDEEPVNVQVGDLTLTRWDVDPDRYSLSLSLFNGTSMLLQSFSVSARVEAPGGNETPSEDVITAPLTVRTEAEIAPDSSSGVDVVFRSPLSFVPPEAITLAEIRFHSFQFSGTADASGEIVYPYTVQEEQ